MVIFPLELKNQLLLKAPLKFHILSKGGRFRQSILFLLGIVCLFFCQLSLSSESQPKSPSSHNNPATENLKKPAVMQDLAYGHILFEYYRGKPLEALNQILIAEKKSLLPNHSQSARLLSGVIYLDLGMLSHAQSIFNELLADESLKRKLINRLEFYLGKLHYRQGDYKQAEVRLKNVVSRLEGSSKDESLIMLSNIALSFEQKEKARSWLAGVSRDTSMDVFSRYNLGISWLREGELENAKAFLSQKLLPDDERSELKDPIFGEKVVKSLLDKSNIALGYFYLSNKDYEQAREYLKEVRLNSLQSNKALLGMGWSYLETGFYTKALSYWLELKTRDIRDVAVQEVLLAIPYAYHKLGSQQEALNAYEQASETYQKQINSIDLLLYQIEKEQILEKSVERKLIAQQNANRHYKNDKESFNHQSIEDSHLLGEEFDYYLFELFSQHQFNEGFKSYQQLIKLAGILNYWQDQLPMFSDILTANKIRFENKLPQVDSFLADGAFEQYKLALSKLESDIDSLKNNKKLHLLANQKELNIYNRISSLMNKLTRLPRSMITEEQRLKARRSQGVLQWQLESYKVAKIWSLEKSAKQIKDIINEISSRRVSLQKARDKAKVRFSGVQKKVDKGAAQLLDLKEEINKQLAEQLKTLKSDIVQVLTKRKASLDYFLLQSDLAIARMHGQAVGLPEID